MKINTFIPGRNGGKIYDPEAKHSSLMGEIVSGPESPEEKLITEIDEARMLPEKRIASRFLSFLGNQRLTMELLLKLPVEEQNRLRKQFLIDED